MRGVFSEKAKGLCQSCKKTVEGQGYFLIDGNGSVTGILCSDCKSVDEIADEKKMAVTLQKLRMDFISSFLGGELYQVLNSRNMYFADQCLTKPEVLKLVKNPNITVTMKY